MVVINALRNHPYNNSLRPSIVNITNQLESKSNEVTTQPTATHSISSNQTNKKNSIDQTSMNNNNSVAASTTNTTNTNMTGHNRNSSSNAILAHLKSLSPNFKSIFVRPKSSKQIGK